MTKTHPRGSTYLFGLVLVAVGVVSSCAAPENLETVDEHQGEDVAEASGPRIVTLSSEVAARVAIRTAAAEERTLDSEIQTTGLVDFDQDHLAHVSPRISGRVHNVAAALGASVRAEDVLAEIDSIELGRAKAEFMQAKARHELARETLDREEGLFEDRISSGQEVLTATAGFQEARASLRTAEQTLHLYGLTQAQVETLDYEDPKASLYALRAPFGGKIVERHVTRGELVTPGVNLFTIADLGQVWIWLDIYERDLAHVHMDDDVRVWVDAYPDEVFTGKVSYIASQVESDTRTVQARLDVDNADRKLRPGMFARVLLSDPHGLGGKVGGASSVAVPDSAVQRDGTEFIVFVSLGEDRYERREVRIGQKAGGWIEVLEGVSAAELVVIDGAFLLKSEVSKEEMGEGHAH